MKLTDLIKELLKISSENSYRDIEVHILSENLTTDFKFVVEQDEDTNLNLFIEGQE